MVQNGAATEVQVDMHPATAVMLQNVSASSLVAVNFLLDTSGGSSGQPGAGSSSQLAQLVQGMAGFGGGSGAAESLDSTGLGADTSQQSFLTTPQHAWQPRLLAIPALQKYLPLTLGCGPGAPLGRRDA